MNNSTRDFDVGLFPEVKRGRSAAASLHAQQQEGHADTGCGRQGSAVYAGSGASRVRRHGVDALARLLIPLLLLQTLKNIYIYM